MKQCPKCHSKNIEATTLGTLPGQKNRNTAKCLDCKWVGMEVDLTEATPLHVRVLRWTRNALRRMWMQVLVWKKRREIEKAVEFEETTEGAFSYIPVIDHMIEEKIVKILQEHKFDPTDARTWIEKLKIRKRPSSLTWELDEKEVLQLAWVDSGRGEIVFRMKEISQSRLTLINTPKDIKTMPTDIKIVSA